MESSRAKTAVAGRREATEKYDVSGTIESKLELRLVQLADALEREKSKRAHLEALVEVLEARLEAVRRLSSGEVLQ